MFVLNEIEVLPDDLENLPQGASHKMTFKLVYTISDVPDAFTGMVYESAEGELALHHYNQPRGNVRKIITLKNKLADGSFDAIRQQLFAKSAGQVVQMPQQFEIRVIKPRSLRKGGI